MSQFIPAFQFVMSNEDPHMTGKVTRDSGGRTRFGIAQKFHPDLPEEFFSAPVEEALPLARAIYESQYWEQSGIWRIENQDIANRVLDEGVNSGTPVAIKMAQECCNLLGQEIHCDGVIGTFTIKAIAAIDPQQFIAKYRELRAAHYRDIAAARPDEAGNLEGWLKRAEA